jgi:hypothetical protein
MPQFCFTCHFHWTARLKVDHPADFAEPFGLILRQTLASPTALRCHREAQPQAIEANAPPRVPQPMLNGPRSLPAGAQG